MQPKIAVFFFLIAAFMASALIIPQKGEAKPRDLESEECTLGSCPLSIYPSDEQGEFSYPLGAEITVLSRGDIKLSCSPLGAGVVMAFSPFPTEGTRIKAEARGTCLVESSEGTVKLRFSRFR